MKKYYVYRTIRSRALIFGLTVPLFALQMLAIIGSLIAAIFSFNWILFLVSTLANGALYIILIKLAQGAQSLKIGKVFPKMISNKKITAYDPHNEL
ncbi:hypothetical protein [Flagellimonas amoyensis]|uniref:hypothetical protein n=1 Tax=Flagellimonas amoyensis TaxID=2169401 RepID=UPI000D353A34|nr:hypothetical protein [Allomuricauda amoyensis]